MIITDADTIAKTKELYELNGGEWEHVNLFGIGNDEGDNNWNDVLGMVTDDCLILSPGTTKPGTPATNNHRVGADHLPPGFYYHIWALGWHGAKGKYYRHKAFVQGPRKIDTVRDTNRNGQIDPDDLMINDAEWWGINIQTVVGNPDHVGNWSWGCQCFRSKNTFDEIVNRAVSSEQSLFSYLLMPLKSENKFLYKMGI